MNILNKIKKILLKQKYNKMEKSNTEIDFYSNPETQSVIDVYRRQVNKHNFYISIMIDLQFDNTKYLPTQTANYCETHKIIYLRQYIVPFKFYAFMYHQIIEGSSYIYCSNKVFTSKDICLLSTALKKQNYN